MDLLRFPPFKKTVAITMVFLIMILDTGCKYFMVRNMDPATSPYLKELNSLQKIFYLHDSDGKVFSISDLSVDSLHVRGVLSAPENKFYYQKGRSKKYATEESNIVYESHFYLKENGNALDSGAVEIHLTDIAAIHIVDKDSGKTVASYVFTGLAITAGVSAILFLIVLLTKSSCPFIYAHDGESFVFEGEVFGGALNPVLEREDFMPLPRIGVKDGFFHIRIANELKERQYTDFAHLLVVDHPTNSRVLLDKLGTPVLMRQQYMPVSATANEKFPLPPGIFHKADNEMYFFNQPNNARNTLVLKYPRPVSATEAHLNLNLKNSLWLDYLYGKFLEKFGGYYDTWASNYAEKPLEQQLQKMRENGFLLNVWLRINDHWELVDEIPFVGPLAAREIVIPLNLTDHDEETIEIKLETGFNFWEIDKALIDYTPQEELSLVRLKPQGVRSNHPQNTLETLAENDGLRMEQPRPGLVAEIVFKAPEEQKGKIRSVFLHTKGYYELIRNFEGMPDVASLKKFQQPGYFMEYSRSEYARMTRMIAPTLSR